MKKLITCIALTIALCACTNVKQTKKTLHAMGFTHIETHGYAVFGCAKSDDTCTKFTAVGNNKSIVSGVVGCGFFTMFKGCTVRFN